MHAPPRVLATRLSTVLVSTLFAVSLLGATQLGCSSGGGGNEGSGGTTGSGGVTSSSGGTTGSGGSTGSGGTTGSGGKAASGGTTGSGGKAASGGTTGSGGTTASGGATGSGGSASGGNTGSGGAAGGTTATGGAAGGGAQGGQPGHGGTSAGGHGGRASGSGGMGGGPPSDKGGASGLPLNITLTSTQFSEGGAYPAGITCADSSMGSPDLTWTAGPSGTMSYAVTLTDLTNGYVHWAIWNIPSTTMMLPAKLATTAMLTTPAGAQQLNAFSGNGYYGPCPGGSLHYYQFRVYALGVATLPGTIPTMGSTMATSSVKSTIVQNSIGSGTLTGTSNANRM